MRLHSLLLLSWLPSVLWSCSDSCVAACGDPQPNTTTPNTTERSSGFDASEPVATNPASPSNTTNATTPHPSSGDAHASTPTTNTNDDGSSTRDASGARDDTSMADTSTTDVSPTDSETQASSSPETNGPSNSSTRLRAVPVGTTDVALGFWEYQPPDYGAEPVPLLMFTHGASWQGAGTEEALQKVLEVGPPNLISTDKWPNSRPFLVLAPQNPHSGCFTSEDIDALYRYALANYEIDTQRVYHTGQSCGAIGGWNYLAEHLDEHVTAAVLISGDGREAFTNAGCNLGKVAIWGLHNEKDATVASEGTRSPIDDLMNCDPKPDVKLTIYPDETVHDAWTKTYDLSAGNDIYSWLLEHRRR